MRLSRALTLSALLLATLGACSSTGATSYDEPEGALLQGDPFVPIYHAPAPSASALQAASLRPLAAPEQGNKTFYLAIKKSELGQRWFLSAFMKQFFPGAVSAGAERSLGTRVVTFREQNGKLFVFDVDDNKKTSETFDPEIVVEAYPLVRDPAFSSMPGASDYLLFDPAAGLNQFNAVSDELGSYGASFKIELLFSQRFRKISDGITFEQIFAGYSDVPINEGDLDPNTLRGQGTLGIGLRRYSEGPGFTNRPFPPKPHYFTNDPHIVPNTGNVEYKPIRWNIRPGMTPIKWTISNRVQATQADPKYADYDIVGALKHGIEDWNQVFGFTVFQAVIGAPDESFAADDKNFLVWDEDPSYGAAYANWRTNPNTGEIRGASVYMNISWLEGAVDMFKDDAPASPGQKTPGSASDPLKLRPRPKAARLLWAGVPDTTTCLLWAPHFRDPAENPTSGGGAAPLANDVGKPLTKKEKVFNYLKNTMLHEIGHDLGLRHNFKGSTSPLTSSIMDYLGSEDDYRNTGIGEYDRQAIKYLYHLSEDLPTAAFCTDDSVSKDPECSQFDSGASPYDFFLGAYTPVVDDFLTGANENPPNRTLNNVLKFVRAGKDSATRQKAFNDAIERVKVLPAGATLPANVKPERFDAVARRIFARLYLDEAKLRERFVDDPTDPAVTSLVVAEARGNLMNADSLRSWATRRVMVDVLKKVQTVDALAALRDAEADLKAKRPSLTGADANQADDLLARIATATAPYFTK